MAQSAVPLPELRRAGNVTGITEMENGDVIVSGTFDRIGTVTRRGLARLTAGGAVIPEWRADFDSGVLLMQRVGPWIYVAGSFSFLNERAIAPQLGLISGPVNLLRLDAATGALDTGWYYIPNDTLNCFLVDGDRLIVGGSTVSLGQPYVRIRALDLETLQQVGGVMFFNFGTEVRTLKRLGSHIYAAGSFTVATTPSTRYGVARFLASTLAFDPGWTVSTAGLGGFSFPVYDVDADSQHVYLGGGFSTLNGLTMNSLARVSVTDASLDPAWRPNVRGPVVKVVLWNGHLYADGPLDQVGNTSRIGLFRVAVNAGAGAFDNAWNLNQVNSVTCFVPSATRLYAGGYLATDAAMGILSLNPSGSILTDFLPQVSEAAAVKTMIADGSGVIIGGDFTHAGGQRAAAVARLTGSGALDPAWNANVRGWEIFIEKLVRDSGGAVFLAGEFLEIQGVRRSNLAKLAATGSVDTTWAPNPSGTVNTATILGPHLYIGGSFQNLDNSPNRFKGIARLNLASGTADDGWIPDITYSPANRIYVVEPDGADHVLVGGFFNVGGGISPVISNLARIHRTTAELTAAGNPNGEIRAAAQWNGALWLAGNFDTLNGAGSPNIIQRAGLGWTASSADPLGAVHSLTVAGGKLTAAGSFQGVLSGGVVRPVAYLMRLTPAGLDPDWWPAPDRAVQSVVADGAGVLWVGGGFSRVSTAEGTNLAKLPESAVLPEIIGWGAAYNPSVSPPAALRDVMALGRGLAHGLAVKVDGTVVGWGVNTSGQATPPPGMPAAVAVAGGAGHSVALHENGSVTVWGDLDDGALAVPPGLSDVVQIASGLEFIAALRRDGTVFCWGGNFYGELDVPPGLSQVVRIACGAYHAIALKADGTVVSWGTPPSGTITTPAGLPRAIDVAASTSGCGILTESRTVQVWGANLDGQLSVPGGLSGVEALHGMTNGFLARLPDGTLSGWGRNTEAQLIPPAFIDTRGAAHVAAFGNAVAAAVGDTREARRPRWLAPRFLLAARNQPFAASLPVGSLPTSISAAGVPAGMAVSGNPPRLTGTPDAAGEHNLTLSAGNGSGTAVHQLRLTILGEPPAAPSFAAWAAARGLSGDDAAMLADPDRDSRVNLIEYATDGNPRLADNPAADLHFDPPGYEWTFNRAMNRPDIDILIQYSPDAQSWFNVAFSNAGRRLIAVPGWVAYEEAASTTRFACGVGQTSGMPDRGFFRMRVTQR